MNNIQIVAGEVIDRGIMTEDAVNAILGAGSVLPFFTYQEWQKRGYQVRKGEKALFKTKLWRVRKSKEEKEEEERGEIQLVKDYIMVTAAIFGREQVDRIEGKKEERQPKPSQETTPDFNIPAVLQL